MAMQFPGNAVAATNLGVLSGTEGIMQNVSAGSFDNFYNFTVATGGDVAYAITAVLFRTQGVSITSANIYRGTGSSLADFTPSSLVSGSTNSPPFVTGDFVITTTAGDATGLSASNGYTLVISGTSHSASAYSGAITLSPVPEPETYALLGAGLALVGFMVRRRHKTGYSGTFA